MIISSVLSIPVHADTLREVRQSQVLEKIEQQTGLDRSRREVSARGKLEGHRFMQGIDPNSEFAQLWLLSNDQTPLLSWLGAEMPGYSTRLEMIVREQHLLKAEAKIFGPLRSTVTLQVLIPHPTQQLLAEHDVIMEIANLQPPNLRVITSEEVTIGELHGMFYQYKRARGGGEECSVLFHVARHGVVNLRVRDCDHSPVMLDVAKRLDLKRFNEKLNS